MRRSRVNFLTLFAPKGVFYTPNMTVYLSPHCYTHRKPTERFEWMGTAYTPVETLKLQGVKCPFNYVKTKLYLEEMELGEVLEAIVDEGEPSEHVPKSLKEDGQKILDQFKDDEGFIHIVVEKIVEY